MESQKQTTQETITVGTAGIEQLEMEQKPRVALTRQELMEVANKPLWVGLRNGLFASFWLIVIATILAAVSFVISQPGCKKQA